MENEKMAKTDRALLIFIKNPEKGKVKTRLAKDAGDERALAIYLELLRHTREIALSLDVHRHLFYSSFVDTADDWPADAFQKQVQEPGDLGSRMKDAFRQAFRSASSVVIIGSDCASLSKELVEQAFTALQEYDFVIGPAIDGGYYLLGMRSFQPSVFDLEEWSTEDVFSETIRRIETLGATYHCLTELSDIDYLNDWETYGWVF
jgi:rSAM/selenodomain-associated transferase 1